MPGGVSFAAHCTNSKNQLHQQPRRWASTYRRYTRAPSAVISNRHIQPHKPAALALRAAIDMRRGRVDLCKKRGRNFRTAPVSLLLPSSTALQRAVGCNRTRTQMARRFVSRLRGTFCVRLIASSLVVDSLPLPFLLADCQNVNITPYLSGQHAMVPVHNAVLFVNPDCRKWRFHSGVLPNCSHRDFPMDVELRFVAFKQR